MTPTFKKLNFKGQKSICILQHPEEFASEVNTMRKVSNIIMDIKECKEINFILTFVKTINEIEKISHILDEKLKGDGIVWFAYPKGTSKKYNVEINRDHGWESIEAIGLEGVRAVAIDKDWSALRFRRIEFVKTKK